MRKSNYLLNPYTKRAHVSIDKNVEMSEDLINFPDIAIKNTTKFVEAKVNGEAPKLVPVSALCITKLLKKSLQSYLI